MVLENTKIVLFQVKENQSKIQKIVTTAHEHFGLKESLLFFVEDEKALHFMDDLLWRVPEQSFLPHSTSDLISRDRIVITKTKTNVNGSIFAFNLCPTPLLMEGFKVIYDFEDLTSLPKKNLSSLRFQAYKEARMSIEAR